MGRTGPIRVVYTPVALHAAGSERQMLALAQRLPRDRFEVEFILLASALGFPVESDPGVQPTRSISLEASRFPSCRSRSYVVWPDSFR